VIGFLGNPDYKNEELLDTEAGYRLELGSTVSLDVAAFRGHYNGLTTNEPLAPVFETTPGPPHLFIARRYENRLQADTSGVEIAAHVTPVSAWRVDASYSGFRLTPHRPARIRPRPLSMATRLRISGSFIPAFDWGRGPKPTRRCSTPGDFAISAYPPTRARTRASRSS
jgi:outer membrane receptor protein involved in Fe transport